MTTIQAPAHKRGYQACNLCREKRVRCQLGSVDAPHKPPCARCQRENRECRFSATRKRAAKKAGSSLRDNKLSSEKSTMARAAPNDGFQSDTRSLRSGNTATGTSDMVCSSSLDHRPIIPSSEGEQTAASLLQGPIYTSNDTLNLLHEAGQRSEHEHVSAGLSDKSNGNPTMAKLDSPNFEPNGKGTGVDIALEAWANLRFVRCGLFSAEEALAYVNHFYDSLAPFSPVLSLTFEHPSQHPKLLEEEPILTMTILMLASRYMNLTGPGALSRSYVIHDRLWKYLQGMISRVFWSEEHAVGRLSPIAPFSRPMSGYRTDDLSYMGLSPSIYRTLGTCEALLLLLEWHPRALHFPSWDEDTTSIIMKDTGIAHSLTNDAGRYGRFRSGIDWLARSDRMCWSLLGTALSVAVELGVFDEYDNFAIQSNKCRAVARDPSQDQRADRIQQLICAYSIQTSGRLGWKYLTPFPIAEQRLVSEDDATNCWVGIAALLKKGIDLLFPSRNRTNEIVKSGEYVKYIQLLQPSLRDWEKNFDNAKCITPSNKLWRTQWKTDRYAVSRSMRSILSVEYGYVRVYIYSVAFQAIIERRVYQTNVRILESSSSPSSDSVDDENLKQITAAARSVLRTVVYEIFPDDKLKYIPVRTYSRILAGSLCLLRTCAIDINKDEAGISLALVDAAAQALRNSVIDDLNLCTRWGELLHTLSSNLRERLEQMSATKSGPNKNTTLSQEAPRSQTSDRDLNISESIMDPLFDVPQQNMNTAASNLGDSNILNPNDVFYPGINQVHTDVNNYASSWDDMSLWLDPLGHVSATGVSQMPWRSDQGMYGMLEPFMGGMGEFRNPYT